MNRNIFLYVLADDKPCDQMFQLSQPFLRQERKNKLMFPISVVSRQKSFREVSSTGASMTSAMSSSNDYYGGESDVMLKVNNDPNPAMDTSVHSVTFSDIDLNDD